MATSSSRARSSGPVLRSLSPSGRFCSSTASNSSFASSSSAFASSFSSSSSSFFHRDLHHQSHYQYHHHHHCENNNHHHHNHHHQRSASPTRVNLYTTSASLSPSVRFSIDHRSISPNRNQVLKSNTRGPIPATKKRCMCSPTSHPGSFRCSLHKNSSHGSGSHHAAPYPSNRLNMLRSAMTNSLVRIGGVEGDWVKRALTALIRPSSHQLRRRAAFHPRPSRLSVMSKIDDL